MNSNFSRIMIACIMVAIFLLAFLLGACSTNKASAGTDTSFSISGSTPTGNYQVAVLTDSSYGVEYLVVWTTGRPYDTLAITPRYRSTEFLR